MLNNNDRSMGDDIMRKAYEWLWGQRCRDQNRLKLIMMAAVILFSICSGVLNGRASAEGDTWVDGSYPTIELLPGTVADSSHPNVPCYKMPVTFQWYNKPDGSYSTIPRDVTTTICATHNESATVSQSGYVSLGGYAYPAIDFDKFANLTAIPHQSNFLWQHSTNEGYGRSISFFADLASVGTFKQVHISSPTTVSGYQTPAQGYSIDKPQFSPVLKDSNNKEVRINAFNFSRNGEWMIAEMVDTGIVRINTQSKSMQLISTAHFSYNMGSSNSMNLGISDDGSYALSSVGGADVVAYDLRGCKQGQFSSYYADNSAATSGCRGRSLGASLRAQVPGFYGLRSLVFNTTNQIINGAVDYRMTIAGVVSPQSSRITLSIAGYQPEEIGYLALGDSFSSGEGAYDYELGTDTPDNLCHLSTKSYPYLIAKASSIKSFHSVACSGAVVDDMLYQQDGRNPSRENSLGSWLPGVNVRGQLGYFDGSSSTDLITLTLGGNDVGFAHKLAACINVGTCDFAATAEGRANTAKEIANLHTRLIAAYNDINVATNSKTKIYVVGYPQIVAAGGDCALNVHLDQYEAEYVSQATHYLDEVVRAAAGAAGVHYIDIEHALDGSNLCSSAAGDDKAVNGMTVGDDVSIPWQLQLAGGIVGGPAGGLVLHQTQFGNESYHPNQKGHQMIADAIRSAVNGDLNSFNPCPGAASGVVICGNGISDVPLPDASYFGQSATTYVRWLNHTPGYTYTPTAIPTIKDIVSESLAERSIHVVVPGLKPGSSVQLIAHSTPTVLGTYTVGLDGVLNATTTIPPTVQPGNHTIHVLGQNVAGEAVDYYEPVLVTGPTGDLDGDGVADEVDPCGFMDASGEDVDHDGIDDACDGTIGEADTMPPVVSGVAQTRPNENGWYNADVTVDWSSIDADPSSGAPTQPIATAATEDGEHTYTSEQSCDPAGNCATGSVTLKIDKTKPIISYTTSEVPNENGWYRSGVTVHFDCSDATSGIARCTEPITLNTDGGHQQIIGTATDNAGNTQTVTLDVSQDGIPPTIDFTLDQSPNAQGWNNGPVTVTFHCGDDTSKITTCSPPQAITDEGGMIVTGTATDNAGNTASINAAILIDRSLPVITHSTVPAPNGAGWNNSDVTVGFGCDDVLSKILSCTSPVIISDEGANREVTGEAVDNAANKNKIVARINIDKTAPVLGVPVWSSNTKSITGTVFLSVPVSDTISGVEEAEYFIGDADPGQGNGAVMNVSGGVASVTFSKDFPTGVYEISVRAKDWAGNWSATVSDYLVVYDPDGPRMTGRRAVVPSLAGGDILPGLVSHTQDDKATFGFSVRYGRKDDISRNSDFEFTYTTGKHCENRKKATNCHKLELNADTIDWLTTEGKNASTGIFQGAARLELDGTRSSVLFRVVGVDGERLSRTANDQLQLQIYAMGSNPTTDAPMYIIKTTTITRGNIKIFDH